MCIYFSYVHKYVSIDKHYANKMCTGKTFAKCQAILDPIPLDPATKSCPEQGRPPGDVSGISIDP